MSLERTSGVVSVLAGVLPALIMAVIFAAVAMAFFLSIGKPPLATLTDMVMFAVGDTYSLSETLVKTAPILLCALATILPARLGLVSVGADGQLFHRRHLRYRCRALVPQCPRRSYCCPRCCSPE